jgi:hypothetical protein
MEYLTHSSKIENKQQLKSEMIVSHLIKGLIITGDDCYKSNVFSELKLQHSIDLCDKAIKVASDLGYCVSFGQHRACVFATIKPTIIAYNM